MNHRNCLCVRTDQRLNRGSRDRAGIRINVGKHRLGKKQHGTGSGRNEGARRGDQLITLAEAYGQISSRKSQRAVGHSDSLTTATPLGKLTLKSLCFITGPGVHLAGSEHMSRRIDLVAIEVRP